MKSHNIQSDISTLKRALLFALVYFVLFNSSVVLYNTDNGHLPLTEIGYECLYVYIMLTLNFVGFSINNVLFAIYSVFIYSTGALASYFIYSSGTLPTKRVIADFLDISSLFEYDLISIKLVLWLILSIWLCIYLLKKYDAKPNQNKASVVTIFMLFILSIANIITPFMQEFKTYLPVNYLHNSYHYFLDSYSISSKTDIARDNKNFALDFRSPRGNL